MRDEMISQYMFKDPQSNNELTDMNSHSNYGSGNSPLMPEIVEKKKKKKKKKKRDKSITEPAYPNTFHI